MATAALESGPAHAPVKPWRNPFLIAFVFGAATLTALPFLQRLTLRAPPPLAPLGTWSLPSVGGGAPLGADALFGKVWLASFVPSPCDSDCEKDLAHFAGAAQHISDLKDRVAMVTFVESAAVETAQRHHPKDTQGWHLLTGEPETLGPVWARFAEAWQQQTERLTERSIVFMARPTYAVVDQDGAVRGFWPADDEGRGHAINAVRMFARYGATP